MSDNERRVRFAWAFTLIEMLVVIAIIGILAAILLPMIGKARLQSRIATARSDIAGLAAALSQYSLDFGALPLDTKADLDSGFADMNTPNECLVWFLTRTYSRAANAPGKPDGYPGAGWATPPADSLTVFSRVSGGPYYSPKTRSVRDYDEDNFSEFVDPWGRPYMYRARPRTCNVTATNVSGNEYTFTLGSDTQSGTAIHGMNNTAGVVNLQDGGGATLASGAYSGVADRQIKVTLATPPSDSVEQVQFRLHNAEGGDLYSLGPDGLTRAKSMPREDIADEDTTSEWKPATGDAVEIGKWTHVWGASGDGNDISGTGANVVIDEKHKDDINNWQ